MHNRGNTKGSGAAGPVADRPEKRKPVIFEPCAAPTEAERAALFKLNYEQALAALEKEDPVAVAVATEFILDLSEQVGVLLKEGKDYLAFLTPLPNAPAIERIAMEMVMETVEDELAEEEV